MKKVKKFFSWIISAAISFGLFLPIINLLMLGIRYLQTQEVQPKLGFFSFTFGVPSFLLLALSWPLFLIFSYHYYKETENLVKQFFKLTAIQLFIIPGLVLVYIMIFPNQLQQLIGLGSGGLVLGLLSWLIYKYKTNERR